MANDKRVCIFVDGENLRHNIGELFPSFDKRLYLPKADWTEFFDWISCRVAGPNAERVRAYWYAVQNIDFSPPNLNSVRKKDSASLATLLCRDPGKATLISTTPVHEREGIVQNIANELEERKLMMEKRFAGWAQMHNLIAEKNTGVEFRKAGAIRYDLFTGRLGSEKAVDVKLATDLIKLKDIYDIAVIVSGDQDYVPAIDLIKDYGKHTVNVAFLTQNDELLPGGARRLNQSTDRSIEISHSDLKRLLGL